MHRQNRFAFIHITQILLDILSICIAFLVAYVISSNITQLHSIERYLWILPVFTCFWVLIMYVYRMYFETTFMYLDRIIKDIIKSTVFSGCMMAAFMYSVKEDMLSRILFILFLVSTSVIVTVTRVVYSENLKRKRGVHGSNVLFLGSPEIYKKYKYYIDKTHINVNIVKFININKNENLFQSSLLKDKNILKDIISEYVVDEVIFGLPKKHIGELDTYIRYFEEMGITVRVLLDLFEPKVSKTLVSSVGPIPMVTFHSVSLNDIQLDVKRIIDIAGALVGMLILLVVGPVIAVAIRAESKGPVIFKQKRVGMRGRIFECYKFRSMYFDAEERKDEFEKLNQVKGGLMFKVKNDPRITKVGKFIRKTSLDELPQFINVLKGDMSLVGTRPPTLDEVDRYETKHRRRISIKPGITGMWQVSGRSSVMDFDEVVKLDVNYIDNWSIWLDFKILLKTFFVVFNRRGAY